MSSKQEDEEVVMTPLRAKEGKVMKVERVKSTKLNKKTVQHVAGGPYKGIIINKAANEIPDIGDPDTLRDFACYIADPNSKDNLIKEKRQLRFWFRSGVDNEEVEKLGEAFFQEVINPNEFPKDYIGYIKRIIVLLRMFPEVKKMELEMRPPRPGEDDNIHTIRHQVTRITRKVITTPGGRGQEDIHQYEDGEYDTSGGNLENGHSSSSSTPHGASLDRSARNVPSQDDQHRQHGRRGVDGGYIEDGYEGSSSTPQGASLDRSARNVPSQDDQFRQDGRQGADGGYIEDEYEDSVSATAGGAARWKKGKTQEDRHRQHGQNGTYEDEIEQEFSVTSSSTPLGASRGRRDPTQDDHLRQAGYHGAGQDSVNSQYTNQYADSPDGRAQTAPVLGRYGSRSYEQKLRESGKDQPEGATQEDIERLISKAEGAPVTGRWGSRSYEKELKGGVTVVREVVTETHVTTDRVEPIIVEERAQVKGSRLSANISSPTQEDLLRQAEAERALQEELERQAEAERALQEELERAKQAELARQAELERIRGTRLFNLVMLAREKAGYNNPSHVTRTQDDYLRHLEVPPSILQTKQTSLYYSVSGTPYGREQEDSTKIKLSKQGQMIIWIAKKQRILNVLEDAYPDILSCDDLIRLCHYKKSDIITVAILLNDLKNRGLINEVTKGRYMRVQTVTKTVKVEEEGVEVIQTTRSHEVKVVQQVPILSGREQPTIAIITLLYCEKLAVDAMMVDKTTYVKYKTEGEGQVYTLGKIGKHKVVSTKLSRIGYGEGAQVAAGNYVTRLLGTFNKIEHAFLLGVGGGIPNFRDDRSHVRLGDIVVSKPDYKGGPLYTMCTGVDEDPSGGMSFNTQTWNTRSDQLQKIINKVEEQQKKNPGGELEWETYLEQGFNELEGSETRFFRPPPETDRLYKVIDGQLVEVLHPEPAKGSPRDKRPNVPVVHYAGIGAGKKLLKDESLKMDFGMLNEVKAIDPGFQAVMESIDGNRTESFAIIRGVSDYADGMSRKEWHPFASLAAASFMKSIIKAIPVPDDD